MAKQDRKRFLANPKAADFVMLSDLEFARDIFTFKINLDKDKKKQALCQSKWVNLLKL